MASIDHIDRVEVRIASRLYVVMLGGIAVFLLALLGVEMTRAAGNVASIWLPNVVALGMILRVRGRMRGLAFVVSGIAIFLANFLYGDGAALSAGLTVANLLEIAVASTILILSGFKREDIVENRGFFRFVTIAGIVAPLVGGAMGALVLQNLVGAPFLPVFQTWVMSGILGAVIIGPALMAPVTLSIDKRPTVILEVAGWSIASALVVWLTTQTGLGALIYLLPAVVIFAGIRLGLTASGLVGAVLSIYVAWDVVTSAALPFGGKLFSAQIFLLTAITLSHVMALLWHKRRAVEAEKEKYVTAVQGAHDGFLFVDAANNFVAWNPALENILPWVGSGRQRARPEYEQENQLIFARLKSGERITDMPFRRPDGQGGVVEVLLSGTPVFDAGRYQGATLILRDVREEMRLREAERRRGSELEAFIDASSDGVVGTDHDGIINIWNKAAAKLYGKTTEEAVGTSIFDLQGGADRATRTAFINRLSAGGSVQETISIRNPLDQQEREVALSINPIFDSNNEFAGTAAVVVDLSPLLEMHRAKDLAENNLADAMASITDAIALYDADERLVSCNQAYASMVGYDRPEEVLSARWEELLNENIDKGIIVEGEEGREFLISERRRIRATGGEQFILLLDGDRWVLGRDFPTADGGFISTRQDISQLKYAEAELEKSNRELEQFAFVASHDLQEPLRKINSFGSILVSEYAGNLPPDAQEFLGSMMKAALRMQSLIQDLLSYSQLRHSDDKLDDFDLDELVSASISDLSLAIEEAGATIDVKPLGNAHFNRSGMLRVVQNLVLNSIKYRDPDRPLRIEIALVGSDRNTISFSVKDNGRGFDMRFAEQIMQPFKRLHSQAAIPGTGLGLPIVDKILKNSGGRLQARGELGVGAEFIVSVLRPQT